MGTIPTIATATAGTVGTAAYMNSIKAANDFWALTPRAYVDQSSVTSVANSAASWTLPALRLPKWVSTTPRPRPSPLKNAAVSRPNEEWNSR